MRQIIFFALLIMILGCRNQKNERETWQHNQDTITIKVFEIDTGGYGYDILINGKVYIHQDIIPAVGGYFTFSSYDKAYKTARYVAQKLANGNMLPGVTVRELDSLGVLDPAVKQYQEKIAKKYHYTDY